MASEDGFSADGKGYFHTHDYAFWVSNKYDSMAHELKDRLNDEGVDFDTFVAGVLGSYEHVIERISEEYDRHEDVPEVNDHCEELQQQETPVEILDGYVEPENVPEALTPKMARDLRDQMEVALESAAEEGEVPEGFIQKVVQPDDSDE